MLWWVVCFSIVATETSAVTIIGLPTVAYGGTLTSALRNRQAKRYLPRRDIRMLPTIRAPMAAIMLSTLLPNLS
jgi:hypothetical protein